MVTTDPWRTEQLTSIVSSANAFSAQFISSLKDIPAEHWDTLTGSAYPFMRHAFLSALEDSGCTSPETGWTAHHLLVYSRQKPGQLVAVMPLYLKTNSYGEYVFDWSWADAYHQHGLQYYPKLLTAIPFTPSEGPRLCLDEQADQGQLCAFVFDALRSEATRLNASGWHLLFPDRQVSGQFEKLGCHQRLGCQYQWFNRGYEDFTHYIAGFSSRKRKNIRKEREKLAQEGVVFEHLQGAAITDALWQFFYDCYSDTYHVRGRQPYLNARFFRELSQVMPESLLLVVARLNDQPIASALSFIGADTLYGRYWGCTRELPCLHFETCYYQGIDFCIANGLKRFDSGAQGEHKIQRGFEPVSTYSNHWLAHEGFHEAIDRFLAEEENYLSRYMVHAGEYLPFRKDAASE